MKKIILFGLVAAFSISASAGLVCPNENPSCGMGPKPVSNGVKNLSHVKSDSKVKTIRK